MGNKKNFGEYYLGLDIGTNSVGWAVTDLDYNVLNFNRKAMWGIRLFDEGKSAASRRLVRSSRRRLARRKQRLELLKEIFRPEIEKVDPNFFKRMSESFFHKEDKKTESKFSLFFDKEYTDKEYFKKYPTIYHLRNAIIQGEKVDIRLVYLAIHHILKNRGHFLFAGQNFKKSSFFKDDIIELADYLENEFGIKFSWSDIEVFSNTLKDRKLLKRDKIKSLKEIINLTKTDENKELTTFKTAFISMILGNEAKISDLFLDIEIDNSKADLNKFSFLNPKYDEQYDKIKDLIGDKIVLIDKLKRIHDWSLLAYITQGCRFISERKVKIFNEHKQDLSALKAVIKKYFPSKDGKKNSKEYHDLFSLTLIKDKRKKTKESQDSISSDIIKNNYPAYIGMTKLKGNKVASRCSQEDFYKCVKKILEKCSSNDLDVKNILERIDKRIFLPKQVINTNSVIPNQLNLEELKEILKKAQEYLPFLIEKDETGLSASEKIEKLLTFRIPYYVGPLNTSHKREKGGYSWAIKRSESNKETVRPWDFEKIIDKEACAEKFISQMTNECTYLKKCEVLPKSSILYSKFMVLNELNNITVNGEKLSVELKQKIFNELFCKKKKVTKANIKSLYLSKDDEIGGIDGDFKSSMSSFLDFKEIISNNSISENEIDDIIKWIVIFGDEKEMLKNKIEKAYENILSEDEINKISKLKYTGWGRLSKEFLTHITSVNKETGEILNIINALYETNNNLMQLLSSEFDFMEAVNKENKSISLKNRNDYSSVKDLYVSPAIKRGIWQTLQIVNEIVKITGHEPKKTFIEVNRKNEKSKRSESRKDKLSKLYKKCKKESRNWIEELNAKSDSDLRSKLLYLYYTQMGKCMYSGEDIDLDNLFDKTIYDKDHIFPRSKVKDDSIDNLVLVKREINQHIKKDNYPIPLEIQKKMIDFWSLLKDKGFISKKKFERLTRKYSLSESELSDFISRQLVETSQSEKAVAEILKESFKKSEIVYVKAGNVREFRQKYDLIKVRGINDFHHAKDAYLNIVVGNIYNTRFTSNPLNFIRTEGAKNRSYTLNLDKFLERDVERGGVTAWKADGSSIARIKKYMVKNNILFTRLTYKRKSGNKCGFFKQNLSPKGNGQFPIKRKDLRFHIKLEDGGYKYGGYNSVVGAYFFLVESSVEEKDNKFSRVRTIEFVPLYLLKTINKEKLIEYCINELKLNEPKIIKDCIKIDSLFDINGFKAHITARSENRIEFNNANQLYLNNKYEKIVKNILKYIDRCKNSNNKELPIDEHYDGITKDTNLDLYNHLIYKMNNSVFAYRPSKIGTLSNSEEFQKLTIYEQCFAINNLLELFKCVQARTDLSLINGSTNSGIIRINNKITGLNIKLINQSVTGLFEQVIDLNK